VKAEFRIDSYTIRVKRNKDGSLGRAVLEIAGHTYVSDKPVLPEDSAPLTMVRHLTPAQSELLKLLIDTEKLVQEG
jgi:hypothetical protein